jgi:hypothetical protein
VVLYSKKLAKNSEIISSPLYELSKNFASFFVEAAQGDKTYRGWVSGDTEKLVSVSDASWKRLGQFTAKKVRLIQRSTRLIATGEDSTR